MLSVWRVRNAVVHICWSKYHLGYGREVDLPRFVTFQYISELHKPSQGPGHWGGTSWVRCVRQDVLQMELYCIKSFIIEGSSKLF